MDVTSRPRSLSGGRELARNGWLKKVYAELLAVCRIVRLYPKSTLLPPLLLLSLILAVGVWGVMHVAKSEEASARDRASILALDAAVWVQQLLGIAIAPVTLTTAMVAYNPRYPAVKSLFEGLAPVMYAQAPPDSIRVIQLVPNGVVLNSYPLEGNEGAMGLDLFASPTNRDGAIKTAADRDLTLVGPLDFVQGGVGFIVREPIFVSGVTADESFDIPRPLNAAACGAPCAYNATSRTQLWGFASALVDLEALTRSNGSKLTSLESLGYLYGLWTRGSDGAPLQWVSGSATGPRNPVEVPVHLPNNEWVLLVAPDHGWSSKWYGGLLAGVVVLAVATAVLLFAALVTWRRHQLLLESLLPKRILQDLRKEDPASPLYSCPNIRHAATPADLLLNMMGDLLEGYLPKLPDVVFIRTALLRNLDLYTPLDVRSQIKAADLDSEVAQALMQQLVGGGRRVSFTGSRQLTSQFGGGDGGGGDGCSGDGGGGAAADEHHRAAATTTTLSYDVDTLSGALAFVLSPEAMLLDGAAVIGGAGGAVAAAAAAADKFASPYNVVGASGGGNMHSCPLLTPRGAVAAAAALLSSTHCTTMSLADVVTAPPHGCCVGDACEEEFDGTAAAACDAVSDAAASPAAAAAAAAAAVAAVTPTGAINPASSQPQAPHSYACAPSSPAHHLLLRPPGGGCEEAAAARALLPPQPPPPATAALQQPSVRQWSPWSHGSQRHRPSIGVFIAGTAAGGGSGSGGAAAAAASGGSGVCAACGAPIPLDAAAAAAAAQQPFLSSYSSANGSSASKLMAVARRFRVGGADRCLPNGGVSVSVNGGIPAAAAPTTASGGGGSRLNSRLALSLSPRGDRPVSQPLQLAIPPASLLMLQPHSPRGCIAVAQAAAAAAGGGGGLTAISAAAAVPYDVVRARTDDDLDSQLGDEGPRAPLVPAAAAAAGGPEAAAAAAGGGRPPAPILQEVERVLAVADDWHFDAWALRDASGGHALSVLGFYLIQREGLLARFHIKPVVLARLLRRVEAGYQDNPYHNAVHAADVLQTLHVLLHGAQLRVHYLDSLGLLAAYFAAIVHDYAHPGLTGDFLVATHHALALRYNDRSPLENHHCAAAFSLMRHPELDITAGMGATERASFRKTVIDLVLSTDMKQHFSILSHFNTVHRLAAYSHNAAQSHSHSHSPSQHAHPHAHAQHGHSALGTGPGGAGAGAGGGGGGVASAASVPLASSTTIRLSHVSSTAAAPTAPAAAATAAAAAPHGNGNSSLPLTALESVLVVDANGDGTATAAPAAAAAGPTVSRATSLAIAGGGGGGGSGELRPPPRPIDETERLLSLQLALKCADIGNLGRELECYKRWVYGLEEEFFLQGDKERALGIPISPLSDRTKQGVSKSQTGFFDFVALPLVHAMAAAFPGAQPMLRAFLANYNHWKRADAVASVASVTSVDSGGPVGPAAPAPTINSKASPPPPSPQQQQQHLSPQASRRRSPMPSYAGPPPRQRSPSPSPRRSLSLQQQQQQEE